MKHRTLDEMISCFNQQVSEMDIKHEDRIKLLGMITAIGFEAQAIEERKTGFWCALQKGDKGYSAGDFKCSVCGEPNHTWLPKPNYCPNCGARMSE